MLQHGQQWLCSAGRPSSLLTSNDRCLCSVWQKEIMAAITVHACSAHAMNVRINSQQHVSCKSLGEGWVLLKALGALLLSIKPSFHGVSLEARQP